MSNPTISVIIPVYNAAQYLDATINCILSQSFADFELILVNDGSKDASLNICRQAAGRDARVLVIDKPNSGVSDTRNKGIEVARGQYTYFVDADDLLHPQLFQVLVDTVKEYGVDMVAFNYKPFYSEDELQHTDIKRASRVQVHGDTFDLLSEKGVGVSVYLKFFETKKLQVHGITFRTGMTFGEDMFFSWKVCLLTEKCIYIDVPLYYYRQYPNQTITRYHAHLYEQYRSSFEEIESFAKDNNLFSAKLHEMVIKHFGLRLPALTMMVVRAPYGLSAKLKAIQQLFDDNWLQEYSQGVDNYYTRCLRNESRLKLLMFGYKNDLRIKLGKFIKARIK